MGAVDREIPKLHMYTALNLKIDLYKMYVRILHANILEMITWSQKHVRAQEFKALSDYDAYNLWYKVEECYTYSDNPVNFVFLNHVLFFFGSSIETKIWMTNLKKMWRKHADGACEMTMIFYSDSRFLEDPISENKTLSIQFNSSRLIIVITCKKWSHTNKLLCLNLFLW